ncbi:hypothetical protein CTM97_08110 [Photobacterium phosphoreum]|uniref:Uncharacterized protein n=1 Tax=Photobacterium phosphoreum TaxID=659 RepID=A0A2T3JWY7_PHOPO|nr:hypothetical protein [Photobacterium phosphoreum]PSU27795.1 hypothetical protein CTM96_03480 [Photobacterium phosphoreum]PSU42474.1 hypothetical protein CTM97_08110 [Photobacterium phosphoreum]PSU53930.1 hypothetical protein C9J18_00130 [Photobacterium phosphoreum]
MDYQNILDSMPDEFSEDMLVRELSNYGFENSNLTEIKKQASSKFGKLAFNAWDKRRQPIPPPVRKTLNSNRQKWD